jgi:hypothetical protein
LMNPSRLLSRILLKIFILATMLGRLIFPLVYSLVSFSYWLCFFMVSYSLRMYSVRELL